MKSIPMILETPAPEQEIWAEEIQLLYWMIGKQPNDPDLLKREAKLQDLGKEDRQKQLESIKRKREKAPKTPRKTKKKGESDISENESEEEGNENHMH
jgi:AP endonuclease-1